MMLIMLACRIMFLVIPNMPPHTVLASHHLPYKPKAALHVMITSMCALNVAQLLGQLGLISVSQLSGTHE